METTKVRGCLDVPRVLLGHFRTQCLELRIVYLKSFENRAPQDVALRIEYPRDLGCHLRIASPTSLIASPTFRRAFPKFS
jgi:hypothetical protein